MHTRVSEGLNIVCEINVEVFSLGKDQANEPHCAELIRFWFQLREALWVHMCQSDVNIPLEVSDEMAHLGLYQTNPLQLILC